MLARVADDDARSRMPCGALGFSRERDRSYRG